MSDDGVTQKSSKQRKQLGGALRGSGLIQFSQLLMTTATVYMLIRSAPSSPRLPGLFECSPVDFMSSDVDL